MSLFFSSDNSNEDITFEILNNLPRPRQFKDSTNRIKIFTLCVALGKNVFKSYIYYLIDPFHFYYIITVIYFGFFLKLSYHCD